MKKKILFTILFMFALIVAGYTISNAAMYETDSFKINIPDKYRVEIRKEYEEGTDKQIGDILSLPAQYVDGYNAMALNIQSASLDLQITVDDEFLNFMVEHYKKELGSNFNVISANFVEINNCKGVEIRFKDITREGAMEYYGSAYAFVSDNYGYDIMIISTLNNYITSSEKNSIMNSFKVKDTVKNTNGIPFMDIKKSDWYYDVVKKVSNDGIITGTTAYTYNPSGKLTRGQLATILWRMAGKPVVAGKEFPDVKVNDYYYQAVQWASANKVVNGYKDGRFGPKDNVTREQLAVMLQNYAVYKKINVSKVADISGFKDVKGISSYATNAVAWAIQNKIISGKENGTRIDPKGNATRAEAAAMIQNYRTYVK